MDILETKPKDLSLSKSQVKTCGSSVTVTEGGTQRTSSRIVGNANVMKTGLIRQRVNVGSLCL